VVQGRTVLEWTAAASEEVRRGCCWVQHAAIGLLAASRRDEGTPPGPQSLRGALLATLRECQVQC